jgi:hypothetical protein
MLVLMQRSITDIFGCAAIERNNCEEANVAIERNNCEEASAAILREQTAIENCERDLEFSLKNLLSVIPRKIIIVFGEDLKLGINLRRTIVIAYYNSGFIRSLSRGFFPSSRKGFST